MTISVKCPTCDTDVPWIDDREYRPFCSKRCQQIDFGDWATESFKIAGEPAMDTQLLGEEDIEH
jgi:endogenous inhibitor of DNA gyrase (YacG/DUF329 family)